jgi:hypothetical protein
MTEERKFAILFAATILVERRLIDTNSIVHSLSLFLREEKKSRERTDQFPALKQWSGATNFTALCTAQRH